MSGHCPKCGTYHEEDDDRLCSSCLWHRYAYFGLGASGTTDELNEALAWLKKAGGRGCVYVRAEERDSAIRRAELLAAECRAWRDWHENCGVHPDECECRDVPRGPRLIKARAATDEANALGDKP